MEIKTWQKHILSIVVIVIGGFILFNAAFLLYALVINGSMELAGMSENASPPLMSKIFYLVLIAGVSLIIFTSRLPVFVKATVLTMPLMVGLVFIGIILYGQSLASSIIAGGALLTATIACIWYKKLHWMYYVAIGYVALVGLCIVIFNIQI
ncbi:MAG: hypothetical protein PHU24_11580 [Sphaerochaetaceae bacterium]|jgi:hypothetical protein|nr:hypothetical protein [Sphaerochaetaceae bacterium]NLO59715.1 hypothetical protein [Spirochaetales bacterium]MDD2407081.1 hypothetical protein [Sphaerochaetaceae bacterium]MDD3669668.1 hypothetical protein [Sphaerochaetaceae bacterium]MDD4258363.1 hypothetical protein [Sphaerochaetaceae bacterium]